MSARVIVVGGGNAGLCAALTARDAGASVLILERAPRHLRGGNSRHTRNMRVAHLDADEFMSGPYPAEEFVEDIAVLNPEHAGSRLIEQLVAESMTLPPWMAQHGARWQHPLRGTLHLSRTNRFFLGGGKALVNAYYRTAEARGIEVRYETEVVGFRFRGDHCDGVEVGTAAGRAHRALADRTHTPVIDADPVADSAVANDDMLADDEVDRVVIAADAVVIAAGGFEANLDWLAESWGDAAWNFIVRGTPLNDGRVLRLMLEAGATPIGDPSRFHAVAVDARSPRFDGGIVTRLDTIPIGIAVNCHGDRFYDEGEDLWPKRYAQWGRLIAKQPDQIAYSILDARRRHAIIPPIFAPYEASTVAGLGELIGVAPDRLVATVDQFNAHISPSGEPSLDRLDGWATRDLDPPKSNWALPIDEPPFLAFPLRPGITFTYHGVAVDETTRVRHATGVFDNVYAAGEIMAGNVMTRGYIAGIGMTVGSVFGRIAGRGAAGHA